MARGTKGFQAFQNVLADNHIHRLVRVTAFRLLVYLRSPGIVTMVARRPPRRVTPNPWYWLVAFVASYWLVFILFFLQKGRTLTANWMSDSIAILGLLIVIWARFSLVHGGAYAFTRHPIYTGVLVTNTAFVLRAYSPLNVLLLGLGVFWFIPIKSLIEESFLRHDPQYAAYMQRVRSRWIPFVI